MPIYFCLSKSDVIAIHDRLFVQLNGFTSESNLDFIFDMIDDFPESAGVEPEANEDKVVYLTSYLLFHLVKGHCFNDGNKRTAFLAFESQLSENGLNSPFEEKNMEEKFKLVNQKIERGEKPLPAIERIFEKNRNTPEYILILLLFELAGANPQKDYASPLEIFPIVHKLIKMEKRMFLEDRDMVTNSKQMLKSKFKSVPMDRAKLMKTVDELIKKNPQTMKLLEKS